MMPGCQQRKCKRVAREAVGQLKYPNVSPLPDGKTWMQEVYLCEKHAKELRKLLQIEEKQDEPKKS